MLPFWVYGVQSEPTPGAPGFKQKFADEYTAVGTGGERICHENPS
jgi:hypothetical protein